MIKDGIYNLKSLAFTKDFYQFSNQNSFEIDKYITKFNSLEYDLETEFIDILPFEKDEYSAHLKHSDNLDNYQIQFKHSIFNFYLDKYKISNKYIILNIEEFYSISKYFIKVWNDKNYGNNEQLIHLNHDSVFYILKYYENHLYDLEKFKTAKPDDIFNIDLVAQLKQF